MVRLVIACVSVLLGGCALSSPSFINTAPMQVSRTPETYVFDGPRISTGELNKLADDIIRRANGPITVTAFHAGGKDAATNRRIALAQAERVKVYLFQQGVKAPMTATAETADNTAPRISVTYMALAAHAAAECGDIANADADNYTHGIDAAYRFGCSRQKQMAAMVARPGDLLGNDTAPATDSTRLSKTLDNYRSGERATSPADEGLSASTVYQE